MAMTSREILDTLKPMRDFAPAIIRAAEIIEAVEQASVTLKAMDKSKAGVQAEIDELNKQAASTRQATAATVSELETARADVLAEKEKLNASLKPLQAKLKTAQAALDSVQSDYAKKLAALDEELRAKQTQLDGVKSEIEAFRARISTINT